LASRPFRQRRFYDCNIYTDRKRIEKRLYIHRNPYTRGLLAHPRVWDGSSFRHWAYGQQSSVTLDSTWAFERSMQGALCGGAETPTSCKPTSQERDVGRPPHRLADELRDVGIKAQTKGPLC